MKRVFSLLIVMLCLYPLSMQADGVKYGNFITYEGKMDAANNPEGKGKLITEYKVTRKTELGDVTETNKDILSGKFSQGKVVDAKVQFARYNGPLWLDKAVFKGSVEYVFLDNNQGIQYKLLEGKLTTADYKSYIISPERPLTITRIPSNDGCMMVAEPLCKETQVSSIDESPAASIYKMFGEIMSATRLDRHKLNDEWLMENTGTGIEAVYEDGKTVFVNEKEGDVNANVRYKNEDFMVYTKGVKKLRKTFTDGVMAYEGTSHIAKIVYTDQSNYQGSLTLTIAGKPVVLDNFDAFVAVMSATSLESISPKPYTGVLVKGGVTTKYEEGLTEEEIAAKKKAEEEARKAEEAKKAEAEKQKLMDEKNKIASIKAICDKAYAAPNVKANIIGLDVDGKLSRFSQQAGARYTSVLKTYDMGAKGKTIVLYIYMQEKDFSFGACYSTSGKNLRLLEQYDRGATVYIPSNGVNFGMVKLKDDTGKIVHTAFVKSNGRRFVSDVYEGMSEHALKEAIAPSGMSLKLVESNGVNTVYELRGVSMDKQYYGVGEDSYNYQVKGEEWGKFYFKNKKLTKWYFYQ